MSLKVTLLLGLFLAVCVSGEWRGGGLVLARAGSCRVADIVQATAGYLQR